MTQKRAAVSNTTVLLSVVVAALLVSSGYLAFEVVSLQGQVSDLQAQNNGLGAGVSNLQFQVNSLQSQLNQLMTGSTTTAKIFSFSLQDVCVSVTPQCVYGNTVYHIIVVNNGTVKIPGSSSVFLDFKENTTETEFGFNSSLPSDISPGGMVSLNSTAWPQDTNATSKMTPGDEVLVTVSIGDVDVTAATDAVICGTTTLGTSTSGTLTATSYEFSCISTF